ncbi:MAG: hypothetical protein RLZZ158_361 [Cyanobacteriota bacterium]|jgi:peroxiredoxin Q/BCP
MQRSSFLQLIAGGLIVGASSLLAAKPGFALGGPLPALNEPAPDFDLEAAGADGALGKRLRLMDFSGQWLLLYFYPRDFTSGCTLEAKGFQRDLASFMARNAAVVGVSADGVEEHASFCSSEGLTYPLLSDPGGQVSRSYGSWMAPFSQRHSFLIDPEGILRGRWTGVRPAGHSQEVLAALEKLQAGEPGSSRSSTS